MERATIKQAIDQLDQISYGDNDAETICNAVSVLEACGNEIAALRAENARLVNVIGEHVAIRVEQAAEIAESEALREKLATLLAETAVALKGEEAALHRHSWHDLPVVALAAVIELAECKRDAERLDWLTYRLSGDSLRLIGVVWSEYSNARTAIDAAMGATE